MEIIRFIVRTCSIYICSALLVVAVVFFPDYALWSKPFDQPDQPEKLTVNWVGFKKDVGQFFEQLIIEKNLGETKSHSLVSNEILRVFPRSGKVILLSFGLIMVGGITKGIFDFRNRNRKMNLVGDRLTSFIQSFPDFFAIMIIMWIIVFYLPFIDVFAYKKWYGFILPSMIVSIYPISYVAKITAGALAAEWGEQYVMVAQSKGLREKLVVYHHMVSNSMPAVFSHLSSIMLLLLSNLFIIELFLDYKGAAYRLLLAIHGEKELVISLSWVFMTIAFFAQIATFFIRYYLDPRMRRVS